MHLPVMRPLWVSWVMSLLKKLLLWMFLVMRLLEKSLLWMLLVVHLLERLLLWMLFVMHLPERQYSLAIGQAIYPIDALLVGTLACLMDQTFSCHEVMPAIVAVPRCHSSKADY